MLRQTPTAASSMSPYCEKCSWKSWSVSSPVPPTNIFFVSLAVPRCALGTAALASRRRPFSSCTRFCRSQGTSTQSAQASTWTLQEAKASKMNQGCWLLLLLWVIAAGCPRLRVAKVKMDQLRWPNKPLQRPQQRLLLL